MGAAWGAPIGQVEVRIDSEPWQTAHIDEGGEAEFAWKLWTLPWGSPAARRAYRHLSRNRHQREYPTGDGRPDDRTPSRHTWESNGQITRRVRIV